MPSLRYRFRLKVWLYPGKAAWHFVTLPKPAAAEIKELLGEAARGWGSFPVQATVGGSTWTTSIFPDGKSGSYVLPLKASVRKAEGLAPGKMADIAVVVSG